MLKGNAEFLLDFMTEDPNTGYWVTGPSVSPENGFNYKGQYCAVSMMPTCDRTLVYEIFSDCIRSSEILGVDRAFADSLRAVMAKLPPYKIGRDGGIQEWAEDYEIANPNHRHTSHLLGFYPFAQYTTGKNPDLAEATRKTMELRLSAEGWEDTEWSRANMICFYARLRDADKAYESVKILEGKLSRDNLMTVSPGGIAGAENDIYAFDGNPGALPVLRKCWYSSKKVIWRFCPACRTSGRTVRSVVCVFAEGQSLMQNGRMKCSKRRH